MGVGCGNRYDRLEIDWGLVEPGDKVRFGVEGTQKESLPERGAGNQAMSARIGTLALTAVVLDCVWQAKPS